MAALYEARARVHAGIVRGFSGMKIHSIGNDAT
jgi:hypothetical protein